MPDEIDAIRFAAEQGDAKAQSNLGLMYDQGLGVSQDYAEAVRWFRLAAEQGDAGAQCQLGAMYATGKGVQRVNTRPDDDTQPQIHAPPVPAKQIC